MTSPFPAVSILKRDEGYISFDPLPTDLNGEALIAWHHAHGGGITLVNDREALPANPVPARTGFMAIDDVLIGDATPAEPYTPKIGQWGVLARGRVRMVRFSGESPRDVALLDRDGTIIEDRHYLSDPAGVVLLPGAAEGLRLLGQAQVTRVVLTNQSGVATGRIQPEILPLIHRRLVELLQAAGADLEGIYICPHAPDDGCACRKPATGLAFQAARDLGIDLDRSFMVGDKPADIELARRLGVPAFLVATGEGMITEATRKAIPDFLVSGLDAVARIVLHPGGLPVKAPLPVGVLKDL